MGFFISLAAYQAINTIWEIDETYHEHLPDGRMKVVFVTTGILPTTAKIKTWIWSIFGVPVQKIDEATVEELQAGPLLKRYKITVILTPLLKGLRRDRSIGVREIMEAKVIRHE